jgi:hypothetical protein
MPIERIIMERVFTRILVLILLILLLVVVVISLCQNTIPWQKVLALSPSFIRHEVIDSGNDWIYSRALPTQVMQKIFANNTIGRIESVTYISDGKTLNATFWLSSPFNMIKPFNHSPSYCMLIDADDDLKTGLLGEDYRSCIIWFADINEWRWIFAELSANNEQRVLDRKVNYTGFFEKRNPNHISLSVDLSKMNYPSQYRIIFFMDDEITYPNHTQPSQTNSTLKISDYVNTVLIPPPRFTLSTSPSSIEMRQGEQKKIQLQINSTNPFGNVKDIEPHVRLYGANQTDGIKLNFNPDVLYMPADGLATSELQIYVPPNATTRPHTFIITANISFPTQFFGQRTESITQTTAPTITVLDSLTISQQYRNWLSEWFNPLTGAYSTVSTIINGILGWMVLKKKKDR